MTSKTLPKPSEANAQVQEYMAAVRKGASSVFVMQKGDGWSVRPAMEPAKALVFTSKAEAIKKSQSRC